MHYQMANNNGDNRMNTIGNIRQISQYYAVVRYGKTVIQTFTTRDEAVSYIAGNNDLTIKSIRLAIY